MMSEVTPTWNILTAYNERILIEKIAALEEGA
jgi:hypothetical protein